jgi:CheY-like chemotaxis protein
MSEAYENSHKAEVAKAAPENVEKLPQAESQSAPLRVLLTEDNPMNQEVGRLLLEELGCEVDVAGNGRVAIEAVSAIRYDIVFMDCEMPEVDGYQATRAIREFERGQDEGQRVTIIALTANVMDEDRTKCLSQGMDDYLQKPFTAEELNGMLKKWRRDSTAANRRKPDPSTHRPPLP